MPSSNFGFSCAPSLSWGRQGAGDALSLFIRGSSGDGGDAHAAIDRNLCGLLQRLIFVVQWTARGSKQASQ
jgi:hypothetical protein